MRRRWSGLCVACLLALHALLVAWGAVVHSPVVDEVGHLPAGVSHWKFGQFTLYKVNPPLVRMVAALPVVAVDPDIEWEAFYAHPIYRPEFSLGLDFIRVYKARALEMFTWARWACLPWTVLGGYVCYRWARSLYGEASGVLAAALWCTCPNILGNAQLITPDLGAAAMGAAACFAYSRWIASPSWRGAIVAGMLFGLAQLTKFTWLVLPPLWFVLWLAIRIAQRAYRSPRDLAGQFAQLAFAYALGVYVINLGYGFEGSGERLGDYAFVSCALSGQAAYPRDAQPTANRFAGSWLGRIPVPLPRNYVLGIDRQKLDFERPWWSFLAGEWRAGGWWYYYLYALAIKVPLGTWLLIFLSLLVRLLVRGYGATLAQELVLLAPAAAVLALVSSQTAINLFMRYVLPIFPFAFVWASSVARALPKRHWPIAAIVTVGLSWSAVSSLSAYPHNLSYFNELAGGPRGGHKYLSHSNTDWGQDLLLLRHWLDRHPEARPMAFAVEMTTGVQTTLGQPIVAPPPGPDSVPPPHPALILGPRPGWYAVSVNRLHDRSREYAYFERFRPVAMAGYSIYIYNISLDEANRVRRELGLPELPG